MIKCFSKFCILESLHTVALSMPLFISCRWLAGRNEMHCCLDMGTLIVSLSGWKPWKNIAYSPLLKRVPARSTGMHTFVFVFVFNRRCKHFLNSLSLPLTFLAVRTIGSTTVSVSGLIYSRMLWGQLSWARMVYDFLFLYITLHFGSVT